MGKLFATRNVQAECKLITKEHKGDDLVTGEFTCMTCKFS